MNTIVQNILKSALQIAGLKDNRSIDARASQILVTKSWRQMQREERLICIRHIVSQVETKDELYERLEYVLGITNCQIFWKSGAVFVAKSGDFVRIITREPF